MEIWNRYQEAFRSLEAAGLLRRPIVPHDVEHSAHLYYLLMETPAERDGLIAALEQRGISCVFHYVPLHSAPAGRRFGRVGSDMNVTDDASARLVRLPLWVEMEPSHVDRVVDEVARFLSRVASRPAVAPAQAAELGTAPGESQGRPSGTRAET
jgi:dTDP-4-amino-4,6-dideoxygalactose transaminase